MEIAEFQRILIRALLKLYFLEDVEDIVLFVQLLQVKLMIVNLIV